MRKNITSTMQTTLMQGSAPIKKSPCQGIPDQNFFHPMIMTLMGISQTNINASTVTKTPQQKTDILFNANINH